MAHLYKKKCLLLSKRSLCRREECLSVPEIIALMCEAFKIQHTARICSVAGMFVPFSPVSWQQKHSKMNDKVIDCITFLKYFSAAGKYNHTWIRHGEDALSVHRQDSCSRLGYQKNNGQNRLSLQ